ncbi:hypothetical protein AAMO2058_000360100 [Amorphochlora amoebiformis]|eukprot:1329301-Amorphochlora_amoeboformis.AAC.2
MTAAFAALFALAPLTLAEMKPATIISDEEMTALQQGYVRSQPFYQHPAPRSWVEGPAPHAFLEFPQQLYRSNYPMPTVHQLNNPYATPFRGYQSNKFGNPQTPVDLPPRLPANLPPPPYMDPLAVPEVAEGEHHHHHRGGRNKRRSPDQEVNGGVPLLKKKASGYDPINV